MQAGSHWAPEPQHDVICCGPNAHKKTHLCQGPNIAQGTPRNDDHDAGWCSAAAMPQQLPASSAAVRRLSQA